jgi:hypothetical protein
VKRILQISGLHDALGTYDTVDQALAAAQPSTGSAG